MRPPSIDVCNASIEQPNPNIIMLSSKCPWIGNLTAVFSKISCKSFPSLPRPTISFTHVDQFAVVEASLTSVKYAFYHASGYMLLCSIGYCDGGFATFLKSTIGGFIGGALFTLPYLILLLSRDVLPSSAYASDDLASHFQRSLLLGTEMIYSAAAGGVGMVVMNTNGWGGGGVVVGMCAGFWGPFFSYIVLYITLKLFLAILALVC